MAKTGRSSMQRLSDRTVGPAISQPKIWAEGRQNPRLNWWAFARVSTEITRRSLAPALASTARRIGGFGQNLTDGKYTVRVDWAGRAARFVPSHQAVGGTFSGLARLIAATKEVVKATPEADEPIAYPNVIRPNFTPTAPPQPAAPPQPVQKATPAGDDAAVHAIRALIYEAPTATPPTEEPVRRKVLPEIAEPIPEPQRVTLGGVAASGLAVASVHVLAWLLIGLSMPLGMVSATTLHLNGQDLRDWD